MNIIQAIRDDLQNVSKKTVILICILTVITAALLYAAIVQQPKTSPLVAKSVQKVSPAHTVLSLVSASSTTSSQFNKTLNLLADPHGNKVNGIQVELSYDPTTITNVAITPGQFFSHPVILFHTIDKTNGRISYVIAPGLSDGLATQSGTVATLVLTLNPQATSSTTLHFLPKTKVTQEGTLESVLKSALDLKLTFSRPTYVPVNIFFPASPSAKE